MSKIHPSAVIDPKAELGEDVEVGPFAVIDGGVQIGAGSRIHAHAQLLGQVTLGEGCEVGHGAVIGADPQDLGFDRSKKSGVIIGSNNLFREHVTIHRSSREGESTRVGDNNTLMVGSHLGHDVVIGNHNVMANHCLFAGYVQLGNGAFLGGATIVHQFVRLGDYIMTQGHSGIGQDVPPYTLLAGVNEIHGLNVIGMRRAGLDPATRLSVKKAYQEMYLSKRTLQEALAAVDAMEWAPEAQAFIEFFRVETKRGVCRP